MASKDKGLLYSYDLFIFDWDGTLCSMRAILRANESIKRALHVWNKDSSIKDLSKMNNRDLKQRIKSEETKNDIMTSIFEMLFNFSSPKLHNDSIRLLKAIRKKGKKVAIFSNSRSRRLLTEMRYLKVYGYFDAIVSAKEIKAIKPNPTGIKLILGEFKQKPDRCLYIGDMTDDIITAKLAHVHSCAIADGFDSYHRLKSVNPDYIFKSLEEMLKAL